MATSTRTRRTNERWDNITHTPTFIPPSTWLLIAVIVLLLTGRQSRIDVHLHSVMSSKRQRQPQPQAAAGGARKRKKLIGPIKLKGEVERPLPPPFPSSVSTRSPLRTYPPLAPPVSSPCSFPIQPISNDITPLILDPAAHRFEQHHTCLTYPQHPLWDLVNDTLKKREREGDDFLSQISDVIVDYCDTTCALCNLLDSRCSHPYPHIEPPRSHRQQQQQQQQQPQQQQPPPPHRPQTPTPTPMTVPSIVIASLPQPRKLTFSLVKRE